MVVPKIFILTIQVLLVTILLIDFFIEQFLSNFSKGFIYFLLFITYLLAILSKKVK
jgi:uncharacterized membrane protein